MLTGRNGRVSSIRPGIGSLPSWSQPEMACGSAPRNKRDEERARHRWRRAWLRVVDEAALGPQTGVRRHPAAADHSPAAPKLSLIKGGELPKGEQVLAARRLVEPR